MVDRAVCLAVWPRGCFEDKNKVTRQMQPMAPATDVNVLQPR